MRIGRHRGDEDNPAALAKVLRRPTHYSEKDRDAGRPGAGAGEAREGAAGAGNDNGDGPDGGHLELANIGGGRVGDRFHR
jgi:hypothetical protein